MPPSEPHWLRIANLQQAGGLLPLRFSALDPAQDLVAPQLILAQAGFPRSEPPLGCQIVGSLEDSHNKAAILKVADLAGVMGVSASHRSANHSVAGRASAALWRGGVMQGGLWSDTGKREE